jgi:hypothetical protein
MSKTISSFLITLTMTQKMEFVSSAASMFITWDVIWILMTTTFSPNHTWLEQYIYICIHKPVRWQGSRVDGSWMFRHPRFFNVSLSFSFLVEACRKQWLLSWNHPNYKSTSTKTITEVIKFSHLSPYNSGSPTKSRGILNQPTYKPKS